MRNYAARRDSNEPKIIKFLERCGCVVHQLNQRGVPDLLVGYGPFNLLMEVKTPKGKLSEDQVRFFEKWGDSQLTVVRSIRDAKRVLKCCMVRRVYHCVQCNQDYEYKESIKSDPLKSCKECGEQERFIQLINTPTIVFNGSEWGGGTHALHSPSSRPD